ncbi:hypothetical protein [Arthrobacter sp. JCM 19049]|uniref:hypothetical protein n=1 Tax=Arthrobacter sp. JCM 19049 TaxID=1460643 RepID=UPI0024365386|nr:hypothetical protein [Arthrobacter sp. JCM 19049]
MVDLLDRRATSVEGEDPHPLIPEFESRLKSMGWVDQVGVRVRELGAVLHAEAFVVPHSPMVGVEEMDAARKALEELDWKAYDIVIIPVPELPDCFVEPTTA